MKVDVGTCMYRYRAFPRDLLPERRLINVHAYNFVGFLLMSVRDGLVTIKSRWHLKARKSIAKENTISSHWKKASKMEFRCLSNEAFEVSRDVLNHASSLWGKL